MVTLKPEILLFALLLLSGAIANPVFASEDYLPKTTNEALENAWRFFRADQYSLVFSECDSLIVLAEVTANDTLLADALNLKGNTFRKTGNLERAIDFHHSALDLRVRLFGPESLEAANSYHNLGNCELNRQDFEAAITYLRKAESIREGQLPKNHRDLAAIYNSLGTYFSERFEYRLAKKYFRRSLSITSNIHGEESPYLIPGLINLGNFFYKVHQLDSALSYQHRALELQLKDIDSSGRRRALIYANLGNSYLKKGFVDKAINFQRKAIDLLEEAGETSNDQDLAGYYQNLGNCYQDLWDYEQSLIFYQKALSLYRATPTTPATYIADALNNMALCYRHLGEEAKAVSLLERAVNLYRREGLSKERNLAGFYANLGHIFFEQKEFAAATHYFKNGLAIFQEREKRFSLEKFQLINKLGDCRLALKDAESAEKYYRKALALVDGSDSVLLASVLFRKGKLAEHRQLFSSAEDYFNQALAYLGSANKRERYAVEMLELLIATARLKGKLARSAPDRTKLESVLGLYQKALDQKENVVNSITSDFTLLHLRNSLQPLYDGLVETCYALSKYDQAYVATGLTYSDQYKSVFLKKLMTRAKAKAYAGLPKELLAREKALKGRMAALERRKLYLEDHNFHGNSTKLGQVYDSLHRLRLSYQEMLANYRKCYPKYFDLKFNLPFIETGSVQHRLSGRQSVLTYYLGENASYAFTISKDTITFDRLSQGADIQERIIDYYYLLQTHPEITPRPNTSYDRYAKLAYELYSVLVEPIAPLLKEDLVIIPDGLLCYLPFEALLTEMPVKSYLFRQHPYLLKKHAISYNYSVDMYLHINDLPTIAAARRGVLGIAPEFSGLQSSLAPLYHNQEEVKSIHRITGGKAIYRSDFSKEDFLALAPHYRIIHFSTHGIVDNQHPEFSYLALSDIDPENNLFVSDLFQLSLPAEMVVLSACQTGIGRWYRGEGLMSLARAFTYAGAKSLMSSLWSIDDRQTSVLLTEFYQNVRHRYQFKDEALRQAKLNYINQVAPPQAHPYYWAAISLVGNTDPIQLGAVRSGDVIPPQIAAIYAGALLIILGLFYFYFHRY